jgi:hypothetical protein
MLKVLIPKVCQNEQRYILDIMLGEFFGLDFDVVEHDELDIKISRPGDNNCLSLSAEFFKKAEKAWLQADSMPRLPLRDWMPTEDDITTTLVEQNIPIIYGQPGLVKNDKHWHFNLDIFGSAFFMLSRYEELITTDRDSHGRFPATASIAYKAGFLDRPIVNEYLEILWSCIHSIWPDLQRKVYKVKNFITCDTDWPFDPSLYDFKKMVFQVGRQLLKEYSPHRALSTLLNFSRNKFGFSVRDEFRENISWMMDVNEKVDNNVAFYFITHNTSSFDTNEDFDALKVRELFREIHQRGHEIGIHPGYSCYNNQENFKKTVETLRRILKEEGIRQDAIGGRMHYLRWNASQTAQLWEDNDLDYDSTLMYADKAGFRCGTSDEFTMYNLVNRKPFKLKQRPLIVMECTVIAPRYEGLGYSEKSMERFNQFKELSYAYSGTFTLLWHNNYLQNKKDKIFYEEIIK